MCRYLLSMILVAAGAGLLHFEPLWSPVEGCEVAILTIRQDNLRKQTDAELLPVARLRGNRYVTFTVEPENASNCPNLDFSGWLKRGIRYQVLAGGKVIGHAESRGRSVGWYDCTSLCVVAANSNVSSSVGGRTDSRVGWSVGGDFDETLSQFVVVSGSSTGFPTVPVDKVPSTLNEVLKTFARTLLSEKNDRRKRPRDVTLNEVRSFFSRPKSEVHTFVTASLRERGDSVQTVTAIVRVAEDKQPELLFKWGDKGQSSDYWLSYYEFIDAVDIDGDGRAEVVAIFHNYEYHCYCILHFDGTRYVVVHKGPEYGC